MDAARALVVCGLQDRSTVREALAATLVKRMVDRAVFDECFDAFFAHDARGAADLFARLRAEGFTDAEIEALRAILAADLVIAEKLKGVVGKEGDVRLYEPLSKHTTLRVGGRVQAVSEGQLL